MKRSASSFDDSILNLFIYLINELNDTRKDIPDDFMERVELAYKCITDLIFDALASDEKKGKRMMKKISEKLLLIRVKYTNTLIRFNKNMESWFVGYDYFPDEMRHAFAVVIFNRIDSIVSFALEFKSIPNLNNGL
ncbi:hypothetical protein [Pedobacter sp.]|uniref:hypothetical protein n=1 Tax=Pedobacter sp. TaxID=1411316 RepID=UPI002C63B6F1|nr:hypothetical protein [Pedobacter sp.]HWW42860.1 hypothetical protein [Pedobacter sp.]